MRRFATPALLLATAGAALAILVVSRGFREGDTESRVERDGEAPALVVHHFRDWHYVERELFGCDVGLDGPALDAAWDAHLDAVEQTQQEQLPLLRDLVGR